MSDAKENISVDSPRRKALKGRVVSDKMDKTIVVRVERRKMHLRYDKIITRKKNYLAHDSKEEAGIGDLVMIEETRPLSKHKCWRLVNILEKAR